MTKIEGPYGEIVEYSRVLTRRERRKVTHYLAKKWGIPYTRRERLRAWIRRRIA